MRDILEGFNAGRLDAQGACERLGVGRSRLYELRTEWLKDRRGYEPGPSGGNRCTVWPRECDAFLRGFLPLCTPMNFALVADELARRFGFHHSRSAVAAYSRQYFPDLVGIVRHGPKARRRWQRGQAGELWQHDSSPHQWWPGPRKQMLLLTLDDCTRKIMAATFVEAEGLWAHFQHMRKAFEHYGIPGELYTDGLSVFGHSGEDLVTCFGRMLRALQIGHITARDPQAKGKIERHIETFQNRLVSVLAYERVACLRHAQTVLDEHVGHFDQTHANRTTGHAPADAWAAGVQDGRSKVRPCPVTTLLDLHLAVHETRRVSADFTIDFMGKAWPITSTPRKRVHLVIHPSNRFWVVDQAPDPLHPAWPTILAAYTL